LTCESAASATNGSLAVWPTSVEPCVGTHTLSLKAMPQGKHRRSSHPTARLHAAAHTSGGPAARGAPVGPPTAPYATDTATKRNRVLQAPVYSCRGSPSWGDLNTLSSSSCGMLQGRRHRGGGGFVREVARDALGGDQMHRFDRGRRPLAREASLEQHVRHSRSCAAAHMMMMSSSTACMAL
jgi:hypothetical protein